MRLIQLILFPLQPTSPHMGMLINNKCQHLKQDTIFSLLFAMIYISASQFVRPSVFLFIILYQSLRMLCMCALHCISTTRSYLSHNETACKKKLMVVHTTERVCFHIKLSH